MPAVTEEQRSSVEAIETARLLLVEDDRDALVAGARLLEAAGFIVEIARTGTEAAIKARTLRPDVIVTDLMMPDLTGQQLVRAIRRKRSQRGIPIIVYTAVTEANVLAELVRLDVRVFAIKPCVPTVIAEEARSLLRRSDARSGVRVVTGYGETLDDLADQLAGRR